MISVAVPGRLSRDLRHYGSPENNDFGSGPRRLPRDLRHLVDPNHDFSSGSGPPVP